jgi:hypothetical protein
LHDAEVGELDLAGAAQKDVVGRHIAMHDAERRVVVVAILMRVGQTRRDLASDVQRRPELDHALARNHAAQHVGKRYPIHVLHDQEQLAVLFAEVEHAHQVRMRERGVHASLGAEHAHQPLVHRQLGQHALERDTLGKAARPRPPRLIYLRHASSRDATHQLVFTEPDEGTRRARVHQLRT